MLNVVINEKYIVDILIIIGIIYIVTIIPMIFLIRKDYYELLKMANGIMSKKIF